MKIPIEHIVQILLWIIMAFLIWRLTPKERVRDAHVIFLFTQVITLFAGHLVADLRLIEYPVRFFSYATRTNFSFEYFLFPAYNVFIILFYPENEKWFKKSIYYISFISCITIFEVICEKYTSIIKYDDWTWYWSWITLLLTSYLTLLYYRWFFKKRDF